MVKLFCARSMFTGEGSKDRDECDAVYVTALSRSPLSGSLVSALAPSSFFRPTSISSVPSSSGLFSLLAYCELPLPTLPCTSFRSSSLASLSPTALPFPRRRSKTFKADLFLPSFPPLFLCYRTTRDSSSSSSISAIALPVFQNQVSRGKPASRPFRTS